MELPRLDKLATKFWEGHSSLAEEQELRDLLQQEVPARHQELAEYFQALQHPQDAQLDDPDFDAQLLSKIKVRPLVPVYLYRVAAAVALLLALSMGIHNLNQAPVEVADTEFVDTYEDAEVAYMEVRKALMRVSNTMNDGMQPATKLGAFHQVQQELKTN